MRSRAAFDIPWVTLFVFAALLLALGEERTGVSLIMALMVGATMKAIADDWNP